MCTAISTSGHHGQKTRRLTSPCKAYFSMSVPTLIPRKLASSCNRLTPTQRTRLASETLTTYLICLAESNEQVVHNPGSIPSDNRLFSGADLVVVFEDTYAAYNLDHRSQNLSQLPAQNINNYQRNNFAYLMNSIPSNWGVSDFTTFIKQSEGGAQYMFMTDLSISQGVNVYAQFGSDWGNFIDAMGNLNGQ